MARATTSFATSMMSTTFMDFSVGRLVGHEPIEVEAATRAAEFFVALPRGVCGYGVDGSVALLRAAGLRRP